MKTTKVLSLLVRSFQINFCLFTHWNIASSFLCYSSSCPMINNTCINRNTWTHPHTHTYPPTHTHTRTTCPIVFVGSRRNGVDDSLGDASLLYQHVSGQKEPCMCMHMSPTWTIAPVLSYWFGVLYRLCNATNKRKPVLWNRTSKANKRKAETALTVLASHAGFLT